MNRLDEIKLDRKIEKHFRSQRELPPGRDYRWNTFRYITDKDRDNYRKNFDKIFPDAPGSGI